MKAGTVCLGLCLCASLAHAALINPSFEYANPGVVDPRIPMLQAGTYPVLTMEQTTPGGNSNQGSGMLAHIQSMAGWTAFGSMDWLYGYWVAADGNLSLDLNGLSRGGVYQVVSTDPGVEYRLSFMMSGNPYDAPGEDSEDPHPRPLQVAVGTGTPVLDTGNVFLFSAFKTQDYDFDSLGLVTPAGWPGDGTPQVADMQWQQKFFSFVAQGYETTLVFRSLMPSPGGDGPSGPALDDIGLVVVPEPAALALLGVGGLALARRRTRRP